MEHIQNDQGIRPFEVADLISFYQSDNTMPKGEAEEIAKAASMSKYLWLKRMHIRRKTKSFKPKEDTIFRPVAPFNVLTAEQADEYLREKDLYPPTSVFGDPKLATVFTVFTEKEKEIRDRNKKMTVRVLTKASGGRAFKLRLPVQEFSLQLIKEKLHAVKVGDTTLYKRPGPNEKMKAPISSEKQFQDCLSQAIREKKTLELILERKKSMKRRRNTNLDGPRKRIKQERNNPLGNGYVAKKEERQKRRRKPTEYAQSTMQTRSATQTTKPKKPAQEEAGEDICSICGKFWVENRWHLDTDWLCCDFCGKWFHVYCIGMQKDQFQNIVDNKEKFKCSSCSGAVQSKSTATGSGDWVYF